MGLLRMEGFDGMSAIADLNKMLGFSTAGNSTLDTGGNGVTGGNCIHLSNTNVGLTISLPRAYTSEPLYLGFWFYLTKLPDSTSVFISFRSPAGRTCDLYYSSANAFVFRDGGSGGGTYQDSFASPAINTWHWMEIKLDADNSSNITIKVNGAEVLNYNGDTLEYGGGPVAIEMRGLSSDAVRLDDIVVFDSTTDTKGPVDFIGPSLIETLYPNADGSVTDWDVSAGSDHYALVDEWPGNDDTDYVISTGINTVDLFGFPDLDMTSGSILGVAVDIVSKGSVLSGSQLYAQAKSSSATEDEAAGTVALAYGRQKAFFGGDDPNTAAPWTVANFNSSEWGVKRTA